ncbi:MAG: gamma-glutamyltransferase, partial [Lachnospiraceae bacterium]|nr:gamma-glutamyltransferase [Lachnospiraceae bacterium]
LASLTAHAGTQVLPTMAGDAFGEGAVGLQGGVSSFSEETSRAGIDILMAGGNAVDAAVATAFAAGVAEPQHSGIGGCGMMTIYLKESDEYITLEYLETTPAAQVPGLFNKNTDSRTAKNAAVPGQVCGLLTALEKYGTMTPAEVLAPAIRLAREGFELDPIVAGAMADHFETFRGEGKEYELSLVTDDLGLPYTAGDLYVNPDLADTLERIAKNGVAEFYTGETAKRLTESMQADGSVITMKDLASYTAIQRDPIVTSYYGYDIVTAPPPSMGGDWLLEMLNIMEQKDIASRPQGGAEYWRLFNEANRICMGDTYACAGDPAFFELPVKRMISKEFAAERASLIGDTGTAEVIPKCGLQARRIGPSAPESANTTHIAVIDRFGNIVSATETVGSTWGCKTAAKGLGFWLNSHISNMNHTDPESADYVMPGKRVRSTISPTIVVKEGTPVMAVGSPGSLVIPPAIACVINNVLLYGMDLQEAINAPRALCINLNKDDSASLDMTAESGRIDPAVMEGLKDIGYLPKENIGDYDLSLGGIAAIFRDENGVLYAGADHRRTYKALAY